ncbi:MAG: TOBE-like domain-containing protein, partial [bacterium]
DHTPTPDRPHFRATIRHINAAGPVVRVELATGSGGIVHAELPQERYRVLGLQRGAEVYVSVKDMKVFTGPQGTFGAGI